MPLLSCCRSLAASKLDLDDNHYYSTGNARRPIKPKSNVVASSESLGPPPKSTTFNAYDDTKSNQEDRKFLKHAAFILNDGSSESTMNASSDYYNKTDDPSTVQQWMTIYEEAKNQSHQTNSNQSQSTVQSSMGTSSTCIGSNDRLTIDESTTSIDNIDDDDDDNAQSSSRRLPAMHSLGVLPTHAVTLSRQASHNDTNELEKSHSVAYLIDNVDAARANLQSSPQLFRSPEVEDIHKEQKRLKFTVQRSPEFEDLTHISDSE